MSVVLDGRRDCKTRHNRCEEANLLRPLGDIKSVERGDDIGSFFKTTAKKIQRISGHDTSVRPQPLCDCRRTDREHLSELRRWLRKSTLLRARYRKMGCKRYNVSIRILIVRRRSVRARAVIRLAPDHRHDQARPLSPPSPAVRACGPRALRRYGCSVSVKKGPAAIARTALRRIRGAPGGDACDKGKRTGTIARSRQAA